MREKERSGLEPGTGVGKTKSRRRENGRSREYMRRKRKLASLASSSSVEQGVLRPNYNRS